MFASMFKTVLPLSLALISGSTLSTLVAVEPQPPAGGAGGEEMSIQGRFRRDYSERQTAAISLIGLLGAPMDDGVGGARATTCADVMASLDAAGLARDSRIIEAESMLFVSGSVERARAAESMIEALRQTRDAASNARAQIAAVHALRSHAALLVDQARGREDAVRRMARDAGYVSALVQGWLDAVIRDACADVRRMQAYEQAVQVYGEDPAHRLAPAEPSPLTGIPGLPVCDERFERRVHELERTLECAVREREASESRLRNAVQEQSRVRRELECAQRDLERARCEARDARGDAAREREESRRREASLQKTIEDLKRQLDHRQSSFGGDHNEMGPKRK